MAIGTFLITWAERVLVDDFHTWLDNHQALGLWLTAVATTILAIGVGVAWFAIEDAKKTRHAQLVLALDARWTTPGIETAVKLYGSYTKQKLADLVGTMFDPAARAIREPTKEETADYEGLAIVANLIETIGALCKTGAITPDVVYDVWGGPIVDVWRTWELALPKLRKLRDEQAIYEHFDHIGKTMQDLLPKSKK
jgi:hypothetical protein